MKTALAQAALDSQTACNLSGLVKSMASHMDEIWAEAREQGKGTEYVNTHPAVVLFVTQLSHLSGCGMADMEAYSKADAAVQEALRDSQ